MPETSRLAEWSRIIATWVGIATAFVSFLLGIKTYREREAAGDEIARQELAAQIEAEKKVTDEHVKAAFSFVEKFHEPAFIALRNNLTAAVAYAHRECAPIYGGASPLSTQEYYTVVEYFDRGQYCIDAGLCSADVMAQLLTPYADAWWPVLQSSIADTRQQEAGFKTARPFGFGLEALATTPRPAPDGRCAKRPG